MPRALAAENLIQDQPERIDIAARRDFLSAELFGRHIGGRAVANFRAAHLVLDSGQAEIGDDHLAAAVDHDIGWLEVTVEDALGMRGGESRAEASRDLGGFIYRKASNAAEQGGEVFAIHVLHGDERLAFELADIVHPADIRMRDLARDANFVMKAREHGRIAHGGFGEELEGYGLAKPDIGGPVYLAHAAFAEAADDAVTFREQGAGQKAAFLGNRGGRRSG